MLLFFLLLFTLTEAYPHCEQILHLSRGQVRRVPSPGYPDIDGSGTSCRWTMRAPEDLGIVFSCPFPNRTRHSTVELHPQYGGSCTGKFKIEPDTENNTELCTGTPFTRSTNTNRMVIKYMVPEGQMDLAFVCYVHTQEKVNTPNGEVTPVQDDLCDYNIHLEWGKPQLLKTYDFPNEHPANRNCRWKLDSPFGSRIQLSCGNNVYYEKDGCQFLSIYKTGELNQNFRTGLNCTSRVNTETSFDNQMLITFTGNKEWVAPFKCDLTVICDQTIHLDHEYHKNGVKVETPEYPLWVPKKEACRWIVESSPGTRILMTCPRIGNSQTGDCVGWFHIMPDGTENLQKLSLCGNQAFRQYSTGNKTILEFGGTNEDYLQPFLCQFSVEQIHNNTDTIVTSTNEFTGCKEITYLNYGQTAKMKWKHDSTDRLCRWIVDARLDAGIQVSCVKDVDDTQEGACARLELSELGDNIASSTRNITLCPGGGNNYYSEATEIVMTFNQNSPSFTCEFKLHCNWILDLKNNAKGVEVVSPNFPQVVPAGLSCRYVINSPEETRILISCPNSFNYPKEIPCESWLEVYPTGEEDHIISTCRSEGFAHYSEGSMAILKYVTANLTKSKPRYKCYLSVEATEFDEYGRRPGECNCGKKNLARIMGGQNTSVNEYTMMACLADKFLSLYLCGATIISEHYALTTASCTQGKLLNRTVLEIGEFDHSNNAKTDPLKFHEIEKFIPHPFKATNWIDIALVKTTIAISFNRYVGPACLPFKTRKNDLIGATVDALGWGQSHKSDKRLEDVLQVAEVHVVNAEKCGASFRRQSYNPGFYTWMFCTYSVGKKFCELDEGGPILWLDPVIHQYKVVGVIVKPECGEGEKVHIHSRVVPALEWIEQNTDGYAFCQN